MSLVNRIGGYGLWSIWLANQVAEIDAHCKREGNPSPLPAPLAEFPVALAASMVGFINTQLPAELKLSLRIEAAPKVPPHKHFDRHGNEIGCDTFHYLHNRDDYGVVGQWSSANADTLVSTLWIGQGDCLFESRVFSTDPQWNGRTMTYMSEADARRGHDHIVNVIQATPPTE